MKIYFIFEILRKLIFIILPVYCGYLFGIKKTKWQEDRKFTLKTLELAQLCKSSIDMPNPVERDVFQGENSNPYKGRIVPGSILPVERLKTIEYGDAEKILKSSNLLAGISCEINFHFGKEIQKITDKIVENTRNAGVLLHKNGCANKISEYHCKVKQSVEKLESILIVKRNRIRFFMDRKFFILVLIVILCKGAY